MIHVLEPLKSNWSKLRSSPKFVAAYTIFGTAFAGGAKDAWDAGHLDWKLATWEHIAGAALFLTVANLYHYNTPAPSKPTTPTE
jgi:hypothetical protein